MFAPALPGFPTTPHSPRPRMRLSLKESRMKLLNAANLDRKSGITWAENDGRPQISYFALLAGATCAALLKESRMKSINATGLHRKSGGKPSTVFGSGPRDLFIEIEAQAESAHVL